MRCAAFQLLSALACVLAPAAQAQSRPFAPSTFSGLLDLRLVAADGEASWTEGGFGKARFGDETGLRVAEAALAWRPRLTDTVHAVVTIEGQGGADPAIDVSEAYVAWRAPPGGAVRLSGRAGLFWPPMSLEHDGLLWTVPDTITPSAINSWAGEETKVGGVEAMARGRIFDQPVGATLGAFAFGDTAGTLMSFRGWALHDVKSTASSVMPLPPLSRYMAVRQRPETTSLLELDDRLGVYGRLEWTPAASVRLDLFAYDNRGDRVSVDANREWSWDTRFIAAGTAWSPDEHTRLRAQVLQGITHMGFRDRATHQIWLDVQFASAYVSATRDLGPGALTARLDWFETVDRSLQMVDNNDEDGWAHLVAYRWDVRPRMNVVFEWLRIDSDRPSRRLAGERPDQVQTVLQTALRFDL